MFLPLHDDTPLKTIRFQYVTVAIIILNIAIFLITGGASSDAVLASFEGNFGVVPLELLHSQSATGSIAEPLTLITYQFMHGGWMHLLGNMIFLWVFADNIEDAFGYIGFILFYLICGVIGGLTHVLMLPTSDGPLVGASGALSGVLASYLVLYPRARVWILLFLRIPVPVPAFFVLGGWFLLQLLSLTTATSADEVAWWAHIGGFGTGLIITLALRSRLLPPPNSRI